MKRGAALGRKRRPSLFQRSKYYEALMKGFCRCLDYSDRLKAQWLLRIARNAPAIRRAIIPVVPRKLRLSAVL